MNIQQTTQMTSSVLEHVLTFQEFTNHFGTYHRNIYVPCSAANTSVVEVFDQEGTMIIHVDAHDLMVRLLQDIHLTAHMADVDFYHMNPKADLAILFRARPNMDAIVAQMESKGFLICDNRTGNAQRAKLHSDLLYLGAIDIEESNGQKRACFEARSLRLCEYWMPVETDRELVAQDPNGRIRASVDIYASKCPGTLLERYTWLYRLAKAATETDFGPELYEGFPLADTADPTSKLLPIPFKRGTPETVHIFRKK